MPFIVLLLGLAGFCEYLTGFYSFSKVQLQESEPAKDVLKMHHVGLLCSLNYQDPKNDPNFLKIFVFPNCVLESSLIHFKQSILDIFRIDSNTVHHIP